MDKVYIVTDGCYSDYRIVGVFSNKRDAKEYAKRHGMEVEEFPIDVANEIPNGYDIYYVGGDLGGTLHAIKTDISEYTEVDKPYVGSKRRDGNRNFTVRVLGKTNEHAVKVASEIMAQVIINHKYKD